MTNLNLIVSQHSDNCE